MTRKTTPEKQPATKAPDRGEAYAGVTDTLTMGGLTYHLTFNNMTFVHIENIYRERYKRTVGLPQVFAELQTISYAAMMAVFYAAMMEGGNETIPTWEEFARDFSLTDLPTVSDALLAMAGRSLPEPEGDEKNASTPPGKPTTAGHGRG